MLHKVYHHSWFYYFDHQLVLFKSRLEDVEHAQNHTEDRLPLQMAPVHSVAYCSVTLMEESALRSHEWLGREKSAE